MVPLSSRWVGFAHFEPTLRGIFFLTDTVEAILIEGAMMAKDFNQAAAQWDEEPRRIALA